MLLIYGNEEAFSSVGAETLAELIRETDALNQELFESGELVGAYGVADQVNAKMVRAIGGAPPVPRGPCAPAQEEPGRLPIVDPDNRAAGPGVPAPHPAGPRLGGRGPPP